MVVLTKEPLALEEQKRCKCISGQEQKEESKEKMLFGNFFQCCALFKCEF